MPNARHQPSDEGRPPLRIVRGDAPSPEQPEVRGRVVESPWLVGGATQLVAVDWQGELMAYELVRTMAEYEAASTRLWALVETAPRPTPRASSSA